MSALLTHTELLIKHILLYYRIYKVYVAVTEAVFVLDEPEVDNELCPNPLTRALIYVCLTTLPPCGYWW